MYEKGKIYTDHADGPYMFQNALEIKFGFPQMMPEGPSTSNSHDGRLRDTYICVLKNYDICSDIWQNL